MKSERLTAIICCAVCIFAGSMIGATAVQESWRLDAAQSECARFNPEKGHFEWLERR